MAPPDATGSADLSPMSRSSTLIRAIPKAISFIRKTARNFNPMTATAGKVTVAQVEHLVQPGEIDPAAIHTPGIFVQRIVHTPDIAKQIEKRTTRPRIAA